MLKCWCESKPKLDTVLFKYLTLNLNFDLFFLNFKFYSFNFLFKTKISVKKNTFNK